MAKWGQGVKERCRYIQSDPWKWKNWKESLKFLIPGERRRSSAAVNSCCQSNVVRAVRINWLVSFVLMLSAVKLKWRRSIGIDQSRSVGKFRFGSVRFVSPERSEYTIKLPCGSYYLLYTVNTRVLFNSNFPMQSKITEIYCHKSTPGYAT